ncbi:MAG TPA: amidophosphoribosyltransferase [Candidatus Omnitrophota bacterium]|nr:amidophosphoribosyltransferase [Candidatus Omnitrophota bacterium]HRY85718.1 amidophosphoribosyltransferase [Candidatus Omnitrophota bacterium]
MSGIYGIVSKNDCVDSLFYGTDYHSHLGTEFGGIAVMDGEKFTRQIHGISQSQFKSKFFEDLQQLKGHKGIGVISDFHEQPIYLNSKFGPFCIVTVGLIENAEALTEELLQKGHSFAEMSSKGPVNTTELIARLITLGDSLVEGIEEMLQKIEGSCSLLVLNRDGVYAARDRYGYTPLVVGRRSDAYAVASETSAFPNDDFKVMKYLMPGEIVLLTEEGLENKTAGQDAMQICTFLWIYTGFPASDYEGINTEAARERSGRALARRDKDIEVDLVAGVPDSGTSHAIGYAMESGKPFRRPLVKYTPGYGRSYTPPTQKIRDLIAKMKLIPIREIIQNNRIAICDDSIVRGTQLKNFTIHKLWEAGAKEVHVRPACPPLMFPCKFCLSTRSIHELAARKAIHELEGRDIEDVSEYADSNSPKHQAMIEWIRKDLGVTTLRYQTVDDMVEAIGLPKEKLCLYCWTGECPASCKKEPRRSCAEGVRS